MVRLDYSFFDRPTLNVSRELLGKKLIKIEPDGNCLSGIIDEVESYIGSEDLASHARNGLTQRTQVMFGSPGRSYVYFTYGIHWMFNIVTEPKGVPGAILIRSIIPTEGLNTMKSRRGKASTGLTDGPAKLTQALGINKDWNNYNLCDSNSSLYIEDLGTATPQSVSAPRIGLGKTPEPWFSMPWNYKIIKTQGLGSHLSIR